MAIKALILDFDGLILDTETPEFHAWQQIYREHNAELSLEKWLTVVGSGFDEVGFHPHLDLEEQSGKSLNRQALFEQLHALQTTFYQSMGPLPGVESLLPAAKERSLKLAIASSSDRTWVEPHLERLGLINFFDAIRTRDDVKNVKPAPDLYLAALDAVNVLPSEAVVFEDSANGITAANTAGIFTVAVPNDLTKHLDLSHADLCLDSLASLSLDELLSKAKDHSGE